VTPSDDVVEDEADNTPRDIVGWRRRWDEACAGEDDGPVDVLEQTALITLLEHVSRDGDASADEEEPEELVVDLAGREDPLRADDAPDDARRAEDGRARADEVVLLVAVAHVFDVGEHPSLHAELDGARDGGRDHLAPEHWAGRDFHVVSELEVAREGERLRHGDVAPGLEHHHCDRPAGKRVSDDQLCDNVKADLLVRDRLDDADRDDVDERDAEREDEAPDWHLGVVDLDTDDTKSEHGAEDSRVPPVGDLRILGHQPGVDVALFVHCPAGLHPDLLAVVYNAVCDGRWWAREGKVIGQNTC
jgi:hypothetical protein